MSRTIASHFGTGGKLGETWLCLTFETSCAAGAPLRMTLSSSGVRRYCWRTLLKSFIEACKRRTTSLCARKAAEPCHIAHSVESSARGDMLQMGFLLPNISRPTHSHRPNSLGDGSLNTRPLGIELGKFLGLFLLAPLLQGECKFWN